MPTSVSFSINLPTEIWLHILSFIPRGMEVRRLIGLNRMFFEAAMNDIFREVMFIPSDNSACNLKRLSQIQEPSIGHRIQSLCVQPPVAESNASSHPGIISSLKNIMRHSKQTTRRKQRNTAIIKALYLAIVNCKNVRDLTLHHEAEFGCNDAPCPVFLENMWSVIGPNLRKLQIISPWDRLSLLLEAGATLPVANLEELSITFILLRSFDFMTWSPTPLAISRPFIQFAQSQRHSLRSLTISSFERLDMSSYFGELGYFPCLRQLRILVIIDHLALPNPSTLTRFLDAHKATLESIIIVPKIEEMDKTYSSWISGEFTNLDLPALQSLKIGFWGHAFPKVPRLTSLSLSVHHSDCIPLMIEELERSSGNRKVKRVTRITTTELKVELMPPIGQVTHHKFTSGFYDE